MLRCCCCCCRHVIFHGPVSEVQQHFQSIGFDLPPRMDVPSWLVEITTASGVCAGADLVCADAGLVC
jgi:hypothetical protein